MYKKDRTLHDNLVMIRIKSGFEKDFEQQQELFAKYLILSSGDFKLCDNSNSLASSELKKK